MADKKPNTQERDQLLAAINAKLDDYIDNHRDFRVERTERFGTIDPYRLTRDAAEYLLRQLESSRLALVLAAAIDRLAQLPDLDPGSELEAILDLPEVVEPEQKQE